jgi:hypothetical protein
LLRGNQNDVDLSFRSAMLKSIIEHGNRCADLRRARNSCGTP